MGKGTYHNDRNDENNDSHQCHHEEHILASLSLLLCLFALLLGLLPDDLALGVLGILGWEDGLNEFFNLQLLARTPSRRNRNDIPCHKQC